MEIVYFGLGLLILRGGIAFIGDIVGHWENKGLLKKRDS